MDQGIWPPSMFDVSSKIEKAEKPDRLKSTLRQINGQFLLTMLEYHVLWCTILQNTLQLLSWKYIVQNKPLNDLARRSKEDLARNSIFLWLQAGYLK